MRHAGRDQALAVAAEQGRHVRAPQTLMHQPVGDGQHRGVKLQLIGHLAPHRLDQEDVNYGRCCAAQDTACNRGMRNRAALAMLPPLREGEPDAATERLSGPDVRLLRHADRLGDGDLPGARAVARSPGRPRRARRAARRVRRGRGAAAARRRPICAIRSCSRACTRRVARALRRRRGPRSRAGVRRLGPGLAGLSGLRRMRSPI